MINILLLSVGTRNKIVEYFMENMSIDGEKLGNIVVTDASELAPATYLADKHYVVPKINEYGYLDKIFEICKKEKINAILSLIDPELSVISKQKEKFDSIGVKIIGSSFEVNEITLDKLEMYNWLKEHNYKTPKSYIDLNKFKNDYENKEIDFPVFVKPVKGSASINISKVDDLDTLEFLFEKQDGLMIQELMDGQEIGADVYIDLISNEIVSIFTKKKILMRAGETDKAVSFKDEKLFDLIKKFVKEFGFKGQIDIDIFDIDGEYYISEVNPRFGGGYPHAYEAGVNHMKLIINNLKGQENPVNIGNYKENIYMMKYNEIMIKEI
ncbi:ATP-grasp domain-containing protein [Helcococcus sueciensis]|uniref:ATP-grasp domain-containing protein n=1 Tax=Helcococcus sueciensis TaxID=241555 RepID=UPI0004098C42|nr:ATP-grasp domain-containing protein [Helcococcus sueciensis]